MLQAIRLKGRVSEAALVATLGASPAAVIATVDELTGAGLLVTGDVIGLSAAGRARCSELLSAERAAVDARALTASYEVFCPVNAEFKAVVTDWQLRRDDQTLGRLAAVHRKVVPIIAAVAEQLPRLGSYADRLEAALHRVRSGDTSWLARPDADSYHTVWFELHQEMLQACGLTRRHD